MEFFLDYSLAIYKNHLTSKNLYTIVNFVYNVVTYCMNNQISRAIPNDVTHFNNSELSDIDKTSCGNICDVTLKSNIIQKADFIINSALVECSKDELCIED